MTSGSGFRCPANTEIFYLEPGAGRGRGRAGIRRHRLEQDMDRLSGLHFAEHPLVPRHHLASQKDREIEPRLVDREPASVHIFDEETQQEPRVGLQDRDTGVRPDVGADLPARPPSGIDARGLDQTAIATTAKKAAWMIVFGLSLGMSGDS